MPIVNEPGHGSAEGSDGDDGLVVKLMKESLFVRHLATQSGFVLGEEKSG